MKVHKIISLAILLLALSAYTSAQQSISYSPNVKKVTVYTTAENTDLRLTQTATENFKQFGQPFETQVCVFVDPTKIFQEFLGIGGPAAGIA
jgi:glucosylceramidase